MKRNNLLATFLFLETLFFPCLILLSKALGYSVLIRNSLPYAVISTLLFHMIGTLLIVRRRLGIGKGQAVLLVILLVLNQLQTLFFVFHTHQTQNQLAMLLVASWTVMTAVLVALFIPSAAAKAVFFSLTAILSHPIFFFILWSDFGAQTVLSSELSPGSSYCAEVIDDDQGALGGGTRLIVYRNDKSFSIASFEFRKDEKEIHYGRWGEYESLSWIEDDQLNYNGKTYAMADYFS